MEDGNAQMAAMQAQFEEMIAKLREDLTARLRVQEAANKTMWYSWYGGNEGTMVWCLAVVACLGSSSSYSNTGHAAVACFGSRSSCSNTLVSR